MKLAGDLPTEAPVGLVGQVGYNDPFGPGGVCASAPTAGPAAPAPHVAAEPHQPLRSLEPRPDPSPLPPGAPPSLAAVMGALSPASAAIPPGPAAPVAKAELSTLSTDLSTAPRIVPARLGGSEKVAGRAHPRKPQTGQQIAEFSRLWSDPAYTVEQIARHYQTAERTVMDWRQDFGLLTRKETLAKVAQAQHLLGAAAGVVDAAAEAARVSGRIDAAPQFPQALAGQVLGTPADPHLFDPMKDPEIVEAMNDLRSEARIMTPHSDLTVLQRKLSRFSVLIATKAPLRTWDSLQFTMESLSRALLRARQVEASIPRGEADPVMLRKEAASQMMRELKSVLTPEEQQVLGRLVKAGADRLMAKGGQAVGDAA